MKMGSVQHQSPKYRVLGEWSLRISKGLMQEGKRIQEFGLRSDLGDREAVAGTGLEPMIIGGFLFHMI